MSEPQQMPAARPDLHVLDVPDLERYEARLGDERVLAGLIDYRLGGPFDYLPLQQLVDWHRAGELEPLRQRLPARFF